MSRTSTSVLAALLAGVAVIMVTGFVLIPIVTPSLSTGNDGRDEADVDLVRSLDVPQLGPPLVRLSEEVLAPDCRVDCPPPNRSIFYGCSSCAEDAEAAVSSAVRELEAQGWVVKMAEDLFWELEVATEDSSTGVLWIQLSVRTGAGFIDPSPRLPVPVDGNETEVRVRISTEAYG